ncbi:SDR family oxidoreductase [Emticicia sp. 21SJ11W-3]|uniref:SDR family oxidoreductase n=1 Tax=Emticicia sp. 21SJ11W-3 TaxID=2916755 RepID=UPI00209EDE83|nr:SDR family NAD(P)-dependent oxidoreductase [Emticicia sp. 21SJ11W-3]UTA68236.1 SDR family NAD(P)-dependent oxidoreductase [Emticicia sp. 21SJ11W-3]
MSKKLIVVSGGSRGIGRAIIEIFAQNGFDVLASARKEADLKELQNHITTQYKVNCFIYAADLAIKQEVAGLVGFIQSLNRPVDVLVNNAGSFIPGNIHEEQDGVLESLIETNLYSAYYLTRGLIKGMIAQKSGYIFNMCSVASLMAYPKGGSYSISKFALLGFSKGLREEMKPYQVKVTSIMPGAVLTDSWAGADIPAERFMQPADIAKTVWTAYSLSDGAVIEEIVLRPQKGDL